LPEATIIHGDGTDQELLNEEGINHMDAFVALTDMDEENIIISIWASKNFSGKIITKINRLSYSDILDNAGIESVISPKIVSASQVIRYVRALQNSLGSNVETLHKIVDNQVEALEFRVRDNTVFIGKSLKQLKLKNNLLIACIIREEKIIIPSGDDTIELNDSVVVISTKQQLQDLNDIIK
jgi:trk system potassium uptake protein TrkA